MKIILYTVIIAVLFTAPVHRLDVARLEPVEVVYMEQTAETIKIVTDTGAEGKGESVAEALNDLKNSTAGVVYMDTADYLIVNDQAIDLINDMKCLMKDSVRLCRAQDPEMKNVADYLNTHGNYPKLKEWNAGLNIPTLKR